MVSLQRAALFLTERHPSPIHDSQVMSSKSELALTMGILTAELGTTIFSSLISTSKIPLFLTSADD